MKRSAILVSLLVLSSIFGLAQTDGVLPLSTIENHGLDSINLQNLNIILNVPIRAKSGAMPFTYALQGNSNCEKYTNSSNVTYAVCGITTRSKVNNSYNWNLTGIVGKLGLSVSAQTITAVSCNNVNGGTSIANKYTNWAISEADGTVHQLATTDEIDVPTTQYSQPACVKSSFIDITRDGSGLTAVVTCAGGPGCPWNAAINTTVYDSGGNSVSYASNPAYALADTNGNTIYSTSSGYVDTLGAGNGSSGIPSPLSINMGSYTQDYPNSFSWTDANGGSQTVSEVTSPFSVQTAFSCGNISDTGPSNVYFLTAINFPTGDNIDISYEQTPGKSGSYTGRIASITNRMGGTITYSYSGGSNGLDCTYFVPPTLTRTTADGVTTYTWAAVNNGNGNYGNTTTVVDQGGNKTVYTFTGLNAAYPAAQVLTQVQRYQGSSTLLNTTVICYNNNISNCATASVSYPISTKYTYTYPAGMTLAQARFTKQQYDLYANLIADLEYDYNQSLISTTDIVYGSWNGSSCVTISAAINNKPCDIVKVEHGVTVSESRFTYDSHGNLLTTYRWNGTAWLNNSSPNVYNSNGTVATSYDLANNPTTYAYNGTGGCSGLFPTSVTSGGLTTYKTWDCDGGVPLTSKDANGNVTTYGYVNVAGTADPFWRVSSVTDSLGNKTWTTYTATTREDSFTFNSGGSIRDTIKTTDGYGRQINVQTRQSPASSQYDTVSTKYGWSGNYRSVLTIMPCATNLGA